MAGFTSMHMVTELNERRGFKREHMKLETKHGGGNMGKVGRDRLDHLILYSWMKFSINK